jgi:UDP-glucose 4-epimerase
MGVSKAMMEKIMAAKARISQSTNTIYTCTRYGNVMASRGSVIPLFIKQIKEGKSLTITDPNMTRFLMSLSEAVDLVLYAFENARQGDIFVQKSPAATILDLAKAIKEIFNSNNEIKIIGTRHGEKLYETLLTREEMAKSEDLGNYYRILPDDRDLNYGKYFTEGEEHISTFEDYHSHNTQQLNVDQIKQKLLNLDYIQQELLNIKL